MANKKNLKPPFTKDSPECSPEVASKNGRKGGIKSGKTKRARKTFKDLFLQLAETKFTKSNDPSRGKVFKALKVLFPEVNEKDFTHRTAMYVGLLKTALGGGKGSVSAFNAIRDTMGEKPIDKKEIDQTTTNIIIKDKKVIKAVIDKLKKM